jgi:septation ring formation regulator EzrA
MVSPESRSTFVRFSSGFSMKSAARLTPVQRAYLLGYRRGTKAARKHLSATFDHELSELQDDYQDIVRQMKAERQRYDQIEAALNTPHDPDDPWLN